MNSTIFNPTINGSSLTQIHDSAFSSLVRVYNPKGSVYVSKDDLDSIAWGATMSVYEKKDDYVKKEKNVCGLACRIAYNDLMTYLDKAMRNNRRFVPMEKINKDNGHYNTADVETGRKFTHTKVGVGREFDTTAGEGLKIINMELDRLSDLDREIIEMYLDDVPQKEIAEHCGLSYSNVRKRVYEIKQKLLRNAYIRSRVNEMYPAA